MPALLRCSSVVAFTAGANVQARTSGASGHLSCPGDRLRRGLANAEHALPYDAHWLPCKLWWSERALRACARRRELGLSVGANVA